MLNFIKNLKSTYIPKKEKVYCEECEFFEKVDYDEYGEYNRCISPKNIFPIIERESHISRGGRISSWHTRSPYDLNNDNNCKLYKEKVIFL